MKRSGFLKSLATLIAAPTLIPKIEPTKEFEHNPKVVFYVDTKYHNNVEMLRETSDVTDIKDKAFTDIQEIIKRYKPAEYNKLNNSL